LANDVFFKNQLENKPFVHCKVGVSLDGFMALENYESKYITNTPAQKYAHLLRAHYDAILVGARTIIEDRPKLTLRFNYIKNGYQSPHVIIFDPKSILTDQDLRAFSAGVTIIQGKNSQITCSDVDIIHTNYHAIDWDNILKQLFKKNIYSILLEGGCYTISSMYSQKEIDKLSYIISPKIIGGSLGVQPFSKTNPVPSLDKLSPLQHSKFRKFQDNILIEGYIKDVNLWKT
tara:strand:+ start:56 stop:751 length:696 start_codon:yes stop_codon:yes gene_type:complete